MKHPSFLFLLLLTTVFSACAFGSGQKPVTDKTEQQTILHRDTVPLPERNQQVIDTVLKYGPIISPTYQKAVCTEMLIPIIEKFYPMSRADKNRLRIITNEDVHQLLKEDSPIPKGVYYALIEKGIGTPIDNPVEVLPGDFVQFWTSTWGHCGIVKDISLEEGILELYSSFPSTDGYGVQQFTIPEYCFFVRLK